LCNIWCWFRLPETKDRTFGEIDLLFENNIPARKFKHTKVDRKFFCFLALSRLLSRLYERKLIQVHNIEFTHQTVEKGQFDEEKPGAAHLED
jgi:hypothetical protein